MVGISVKGLFMETFKMVRLSSMTLLKAIGKNKNSLKGETNKISLQHL
jgi:hypothetical protein